MAVLKHIPSKNADYEESLKYLLFQHNEITGKPIKDEQGRLQLRTEYYMDGINCNAMSFDQECKSVNAHYHKNQKYNEVKSHHYIISFDPRDVTDHGLTGERAQALGLEYAKKNFPGHQALVVTHTDGHNQTGNIHVHIVINSVRKFDVPKEDFMERGCDSKAGYKHHNTDKLLHHLQQSLMAMCEREGLYQVDLLSPAAQKITQQEYWAKRRGQAQLDRINSEIIKDGLTPAQAKFQTQKQYLRDAIDEILAKSHSLEEFKSLLLDEYQITTKESRGRYSFQHPDKNKPISSRSLGTHYSKEHILSNLGIKTTEISPQDYRKDPIQILYCKSELRLVIDLQKCVKAQQSTAYANKVKISNLKQMANTIIYIQENQYDEREMLDSQLKKIAEQHTELQNEVNSLEHQLTQINQQIHYTGQYYANKKVFSEMIHAPNKALYRQDHLAEIKAYEEARQFLKTLHPDDHMPSMKDLKMSKSDILEKLPDSKNHLSEIESRQRELQIIQNNVNSILGSYPFEKSKAKEAEL